MPSAREREREGRGDAFHSKPPCGTSCVFLADIIHEGADRVAHPRARRDRLHVEDRAVGLGVEVHAPHRPAHDHAALLEAELELDLKARLGLAAYRDGRPVLGEVLDDGAEAGHALGLLVGALDALEQVEVGGDLGPRPHRFPLLRAQEGLGMGDLEHRHGADAQVVDHVAVEDVARVLAAPEVDRDLLALPDPVLGQAARLSDRRRR